MFRCPLALSSNSFVSGGAGYFAPAVFTAAFGVLSAVSPNYWVSFLQQHAMVESYQQALVIQGSVRTATYAVQALLFFRACVGFGIAGMQDPPSSSSPSSELCASRNYALHSNLQMRCPCCRSTRCVYTVHGVHCPRPPRPMHVAH